MEKSFYNNTNVAAPLTAESFKAMTDVILAQYKSGKMHVEPDWFNHLTPCCDALYSTMGPCANRCPWECGKPWVEGYCPLCRRIGEYLKELYK